MRWMVCLALVGCATHTGVVSMGGGNYMLAKQAATGISGTANLKAELVSEASQYCVSQKKALLVTSSSENAGPYIFGNYPRAEVQFRCD